MPTKPARKILLKTKVPYSVFLLFVLIVVLLLFMTYMGMNIQGSLMYAIVFPSIFYLLLTPYSGKLIVFEDHVRISYYNFISVKKINFSEYDSVSYHQGAYKKKVGLDRLSHGHLTFKSNDDETIIYVEFRDSDQDKTIAIMNDRMDQPSSIINQSKNNEALHS